MKYLRKLKCKNNIKQQILKIISEQNKPKFLIKIKFVLQ